MNIAALAATPPWRKYICRACGLIYDEAEGDPDSGIAPGTRFEDIPEDWECPLCGVGKSDFEPWEERPLARAAASAVVHMRQQPGIVIVGAGCAGWQMARAIREHDADIPITMVTGCDGDVYDKPQLSVAFAKKVAVDDLVRESGDAAAARLGVRLMKQTHAISITAGSSSLRTTRGTLRYQQLILAHGAAPRCVPGLPASICWRINDLQAYARFRTVLGEAHETSPQRVMIVGAGLVGCELANDLALAGFHVVLLDQQQLPLQSLAPEAESQALLESWRALPLQFIGGTRIAHVQKQGEDYQIVLEGGQILNVDHVISATGLQTPSRLASSAGLAWNDGIAVDRQGLRTNVPNIHALGDCVSIDGQAYRYIEPIARQAAAIASDIFEETAAPYDCRRPPVRVKTSSHGFTIPPP